MIVSTDLGTRYLDKKGVDVGMLTDDEAIQLLEDQHKFNAKVCRNH